MAKSLDIADYIVDHCIHNKIKISNLYLQKIMYFLNVIHMLKSPMKYMDPLITNEDFEAWDYGPVLYDVYETYRQYGGSPITKPSDGNIIGVKLNQNGDAVVDKHNYDPKSLIPHAKYFINDNISKLLNYKPFYLVMKSHREPQWKLKHTKLYQKYSNKESFKFYNSDKRNRFWEK